MLTAICWGASTTLARVGIAGGLSSADLTVLRFATAGILLLPVFVTRQAEAETKVGGRRAIILTVVAGPAYSFLVADGVRYAPLAHGALLFPISTTVAAIAFGVLFLREPFGGRGRLGLALLIGGLLLALHRDAAGTVGPQAWIGDGLFVTAGVLFGLYGFLLRRWRIDALAAASTVSVLSMPICVVFALFRPGAESLMVVPPVDLLIQGLGQGIGAGVVATIAFSKAVQRLGSAKAGLFAAVVPAVTLVIGIPLLNEIPTGAQAAGLLLITAGLAVTLARPRPLASISATAQEPRPCSS